jgi:uncharacterized membrane protein YgcG
MERPRGILIGAVALILLCIGVAWLAIGQIQANTLENTLVSVEKQQVQVAADLAKTFEYLSVNEKRFARHYSVDISQKLTAAQKAVNSENGQAVALLREARKLQSSNSGLSSQKVNEATDLVKNAEMLVKQINGPPAFFDELARKASEGPEYIKKVEANLVVARQYLDALVSDPWNTNHGVKFARSYRRLETVQPQIDMAKATLQKLLADDYVQFDVPLAYDQAYAAQSIIDEARLWADSDNRDAREADRRISGADTQITLAFAHIMLSNYRQTEALLSLTTAQNTLGSARNTFRGDSSRGIEPNYVEAGRLADNAASQAFVANIMVDPPTPTPRPIPTSRPFSSGSSSSGSNSGGGYTSPGNSGGYTSPGSKSGSGGYSDPGGPKKSDGFSSKDNTSSKKDGFSAKDNWSSKKDGFSSGKSSSSGKSGSKR